MVRLISVNSLVSNKNRYLLRLPIHKNVENGIRKAITMNYSAIARTCLQAKCEHRLHGYGQVSNFNYVICRQNSSKSDGNVNVKLKVASKPLDKRKNVKVLKTSVTEVTESSSTQKRQSVQLFGKKQLSKFVNTIPSTNSTSQKLYEMREVPALFFPDNFNAKLEANPQLMEQFAKSFEEFMESTAFQPAPSEQNEEIEIPSAEQMKPAETQEIDADLQKNYELTVDEHARQISLLHNLKAYLGACVDVNLVERAYAVLLSNHRRDEKNSFKTYLTDPEAFLILLTKYASTKNWSRICDILSMMEKDKIAFTPQVYMTVFDCLGRMPVNETTDADARKYVQRAKEQNITMNDIMDKSVFVRDQRAYVLKALRRIDRSFNPVYTPPQLTYSNKLLTSLNQNVQPIEKIPIKSIDASPGSEISNSKYGFSEEQLEKFSKEQFGTEKESRIVVKNIAAPCTESKRLQENREKMDRLLKQWHVDTTDAIKHRLHVLQHKMKTMSVKKISLYPYLRLLTPEEYTEILMDELKLLGQGSETYTPTVVQLYCSLGKRVQHKYQVTLMAQNGVTQKIERLYKTYREILSSGTCSDNPRQLWQRIVHHARHNGPDVYQPEIIWPWPVQCQIGRTLFKILFENVKIDANMFNHHDKSVKYVPVLYSLFRKRDLMSREEVRPHPVFAKLFRDAKVDTINFDANLVPMVCPPIPWTSPNNGGYLISKSDLVRLPYQFNNQTRMLKEAPAEQIYPPLDALNQLGSIPWKINTRILDLAIKVFRLGGDEKFHVPLTPDSMLTDEQLNYRGLTRSQWKEMMNKSDPKYTQRQNELYSLYTDNLYKLSLANHFRDRSFWLPHNMDFRGRVYPIPPHLTHLSADLTRSMLCFSQKQRLGEFGLEWLKLHCINLTGMKKRDSVADRLLYAEQILDDILDSANNPLDGRRWWLESDEPWQTLAACIEISDAINSGDPANHMSSFPIHQDGSCNGLQHYAALGRDVDGAKSVNLAPSEVPQDVYTTIANCVEKFRAQDAEQGVSIAIELDGMIKRKIVKQTVMTTVYGVTSYGARLQIEKQLKNINFPAKLLSPASLYLTKNTFNALKEMFKSAREIQDWLTDCARYISKSREDHVEWISPLGLPVIQPYTRKTRKLSSDVKLTSSDYRRNEALVNTVKEKNAFSPNFIHSLDSCHMMMTSLNCEKAGITFVSVHDCFWTHAGTVPLMNRICREQFVQLHSQPILEDLAESFYQQYEVKYLERHVSEKDKKRAFKKKAKDDHIFMRVPQKGEFDLNNVLDSIYFFS